MQLSGGLLAQEEKAEAEKKKKIIEEAKARGAAKAKLTKSMIVLDVKPWDDTTGTSLLRQGRLTGPRVCQSETQSVAGWAASMVEVVICRIENYSQ